MYPPANREAAADVLSWITESSVSKSLVGLALVLMVGLAWPKIFPESILSFRDWVTCVGIAYFGFRALQIEIHNHRHESSAPGSRSWMAGLVVTGVLTLPLLILAFRISFAVAFMVYTLILVAASIFGFGSIAAAIRLRHTDRDNT